MPTDKQCLTMQFVKADLASQNSKTHQTLCNIYNLETWLNLPPIHYMHTNFVSEPAIAVRIMETMQTK